MSPAHRCLVESHILRKGGKGSIFQAEFGSQTLSAPQVFTHTRLTGRGSLVRKTQAQGDVPEIGIELERVGALASDASYRSIAIP